MADLRALVDDPTGVSNDDIVLRLVPGGTIDDGPPPFPRSNAFEDRSAESAATFKLGGACMSVALKSVWLEKSGKISDLLEGFDDGYGIVELSVKGLRDLQRATGVEQPQGLMLDPVDGKPWHAVVWDMSGTRRPTAGKKAIASMCGGWLHLPPARFGDATMP